MDQFKQDIVASWTTRSFGLNVLLDRKERAARVVEEALELAQAEGLEWGQIEKIARVVRDRLPGDPAQELGGVGVTLLAYAAAAGLSLEAVVNAEILRVLNKPTEHFRKRHEEKQALGISRGNDDSAVCVPAHVLRNRYPILRNYYLLFVIKADDGGEMIASGYYHDQPATLTETDVVDDSPVPELLEIVRKFEKGFNPYFRIDDPD